MITVNKFLLQINFIYFSCNLIHIFNFQIQIDFLSCSVCLLVSRGKRNLFLLFKLSQLSQRYDVVKINYFTLKSSTQQHQSLLFSQMFLTHIDLQFLEKSRLIFMKKTSNRSSNYGSLIEFGAVQISQRSLSFFMVLVFAVFQFYSLLELFSEVSVFDVFYVLEVVEEESQIDVVEGLV